MAIDTPLRQMLGGYALCWIGGFVELEAAIAATTDIRHLSSLGDAADDPTMPLDGVIVAMSGSSEAGSNFTVQCAVNGTPDSGNTMTVNSAKEYVAFTPAKYVAFSAGDTIGMYCLGDTTSKDFKGALLVAFDLSGEG